MSSRARTLLSLFGLCLLLAACSGGASDGNSSLPAPVQPADLLAVPTGSGTVALSWIDNATDEDGYAIDRALVGMEFVEVGRTGANRVAYTDSGLLPNTFYRYRVRAFNANGASDFSDEVGVTTLAQPPSLAAVLPDTAPATGSVQVTLAGTGFTAAAPGVNTIVFGGLRATDVTVVNESTITCVVPAGPARVVDVSLGNRNGVVTLQSGFTYFSEPARFAPADVSLDTDPGPGADSRAPQLICVDSEVLAVWEDDRNGFADVYFSRSDDGGSTWLQQSARLDTDTAGMSAATTPRLARSGRNVYAVWSDDRNGGRDIYLNWSSDGGVSWLQQDVRLDTDAPGQADSVDPAIAVAGNSVYVTWVDQRAGTWQVFLNRSLDRGRAWQPIDTRLDTGVGAADGAQPQICANGDRVYVTWTDSRDGARDIYLNRSANLGSSWLATEMRLDTDAVGTAESMAPRMACSGTLVQVVWQDARNGADDILLNRSIDGGVTWLQAERRLDTDVPGIGQSLQPQICASGSQVYVAWQDLRSGAADIHFNRSTDAGLSWLTDDLRVNTDVAGASTARLPSIACAGDAVVVAWLDDRDLATTGEGLRLNRSTDAGLSWLMADLRVDTNTTPAIFSAVPQLCTTGDRVYAVWVDDRSGAADVYVNRRVP